MGLIIPFSQMGKLRLQESNCSSVKPLSGRAGSGPWATPQVTKTYFLPSPIPSHTQATHPGPIWTQPGRPPLALNPRPGLCLAVCRMNKFWDTFENAIEMYMQTHNCMPILGVQTLVRKPRSQFSQTPSVLTLLHCPEMTSLHTPPAR